MVVVGTVLPNLIKIEVLTFFFLFFLCIFRLTLNFLNFFFLEGLAYEMEDFPFHDDFFFLLGN